MPNLFVSAHGGWNPSYGYVKTPRGVSVVFYTHFAKNLMTGMEYKILEGSHLESDRTIGPFSACPNMRMSGQPDEWTQKSENKLNKAHWGQDSMVLGVPDGESANLSEIFEAMSDNMGQGDELTIHWLACSTLQLKGVGGRDLGLNAGDFSHHTDKPGRYRIRNAGGGYSWV